MSGFGGAVKLTGESEYRNALKKITQNLKEVSSEMKLVSSSYDKNDKSVQALTAKQNALTQKLTQQKEKLSMIQTAYKDMSKQYETNKTKHETLVAEYDKEKAKLEQIGKELGTDSKEYQEQAKVVDKLEKEVAESTKAQDANEKALSNMRIEMNKSQADINKTQRELDKLDQELVEAKTAEENASKGADKMNKSFRDTKGATNEANGGFTVLKGTLADLASNAIQQVVSGLKDIGSTAVQAWKDFDKGTDIILAKTGASGQSAKQMESIYKSVASQVVASNEDIGTSVGEVSTRFGITGKDLESLSGKFLKFAKLNGTDVNSSIDNTQKALSAFGLGADDAGKVLDMFNKVGQDTGVSMDKLMAGIIQNGTAFQEMGLSIEDAIRLMGQMEKSGANSETVMQGLRKALKNATADGTPLSQALADIEDEIVNNKDSTEGLSKAYELFGKSGDQIYGALKNGTLSFKDIAGASLDFKDSVDKTFENTQDAPEKFDLAIQNIKTQMAGLVDDLVGRYAPQIDKAFETIGKVVEVVFKGLGKSIDFFVKNGDIIITTLGAMATGVGAYVAYTTALNIMRNGWMALSIVQKAVTAGQWALNVAMSANPIGLIIAGVVALVSAFVILWKKSDKFRKFWKGLWKQIKKMAEPVIKAVSTAFSKAWDAIKTAWSVAIAFFRGVWNGIKTVFSGAISFFRTMWSGILTITTTVWNGIKTAVTTVINAIKSFVAGAVNAVKTSVTSAWNSIKSTTSSVWNGIKSAITSPINSAKKAVSSAVDGIKKTASDTWNSIKTTASTVWGKIKSAITKPIEDAKKKVGDAVEKIKGFFPLSGGNIFKKLKLPHFKITSKGKFPYGLGGKGSLPKWDISWYAKGGVINGASLIGVGENGAEAVVPLERNTQWIRKVADSFRAEFASMAKQAGVNNAPQQMRYNDAVNAFKEALSEMQIVLDDETAGKFVERTVTRYIYA